MIGAIAMMCVMALLLWIFRPRGLTRHDARSCPSRRTRIEPEARMVRAKPQRHRPSRGDQFLSDSHRAAAVWVLIMSVKTLPDAIRGDFWPRITTSPLQLRLRENQDAAVQPVQQRLFTFFTVLITTVCAVLAGYSLVHLRPRGSGLVVTALLVSLYFPVRVVSLISIYETQHFSD